MIDVIWLSLHEERPCRGYWDMDLIEQWLDEDYFAHHEVIGKEQARGVFTYSDGAIVVLPARYHSADVDSLNELFSTKEWIFLILVGDEAETFPSQLVRHRNKIIYQQTPHQGAHINVDQFIPLGPSKGTRQAISAARNSTDVPELDWFMSGQNTHIRRKLCFESLGKIAEFTQTDHKFNLLETEGFTQGFEHGEYLKLMANTKVAPCPSGVAVVDSFRLYEALESGALPIADGQDPKGGSAGWWPFLFGEMPPFPIVTDWGDLKGHIDRAVSTFPKPQNESFAWWQLTKRNLKKQFHKDLGKLSGHTMTGVDDVITVLVPTSPIPSHPDTEIIDETITSIRHHLPEAEIIVMIDGIREEQSSRQQDYNEYVRRILWKTNHEWKNCTPLLFDSFHHQTGMTRQALKIVDTPLLLFVEHDAPLVIDHEIEWETIVGIMQYSDNVDVVRFHHESHILDVHSHLTLEDVKPHYLGPPQLDPPLTATAQWSQRPHLASVSLYRHMFDNYFSYEARAMIEDKIHGVLATGFKERGKPAWNEFNLWMYTPEGNIQRSYTTDGRKTDPKYDMVF